MGATSLDVEVVMRAIFLALALAGCTADTDTDTDPVVDTDTGEVDTDTGEVDTDTDVDEDPYDLVGEWLVVPCPCWSQAGPNDCSGWVHGVPDEWGSYPDYNDFVALGLNPTLQITGDMFVTIVAEVTFFEADQVTQTTESASQVLGQVTWDGAAYLVGDLPRWHVLELADDLSVTCGSGSHMLTAP